MTAKKKLRKLKQLLLLHYPVSAPEAENYEESVLKDCKDETFIVCHTESVRNHGNILRKIYADFKEHGFANDDALNFWKQLRQERRSIQHEYFKEPIWIRKDNKDRKSTQRRHRSGGSNRNKIRFPRKCRKTAWKRFYKLFPQEQISIS